MSIGAKIKQRRLELGLSVDELADKLGKNRATIYRYESDDIKNLPITVLVPLATALETTPGDLMESQVKRLSTYAEKINGTNYTRLLDSYNKLNAEGQREAIKRVKELTYLPQYQANVPVAAHERTDTNVTDDMIRHDNDIMNDDDF
ncbi:MAG: helix-turn-helix transcriptional regulator [Roseburia sp.]|nr:helix-turn-helix transcriptional regulator [Roseburia sp.]